MLREWGGEYIMRGLISTLLKKCCEIRHIYIRWVECIAFKGQDQILTYTHTQNILEIIWEN